MAVGCGGLGQGDVGLVGEVVVVVLKKLIVNHDLFQ